MSPVTRSCIPLAEQTISAKLCVCGSFVLVTVILKILLELYIEKLYLLKISTNSDYLIRRVAEVRHLIGCPKDYHICTPPSLLIIRESKNTTSSLRENLVCTGKLNVFIT